MGSYTRRSSGRKPKEAILLVVEGRKTEPNYFSGFKQTEFARRNLSIKISGKGGSPPKMVETAIKMKKQGYDEAWCVFDTECTQAHASQQKCREAIQLAQAEGIKLAMSNPAFEVWFISHFIRSKQSYNDGQAACDAACQYWMKHFGCEYDKSAKNTYELLREKMRDAIDNARFVREQDHGAGDILLCNSCTDVYVLVEKLAGLD